MRDIKQIAELYNNLEVEPNVEAREAYSQFLREVHKQFYSLPIRITFTANDPYKSSKEMFKDIKKHNRLKVFTGGESHPILTRMQNARFRAVHDYYGHYLGLNSFSLKGEIRAWARHSKMFSKLARKALNTETLGQVCYYFTYKQYATQKASVFAVNVGA